MPSFSDTSSKLAAAQIMEQILAPAVLRVLEALRHHLGGLQMPQVDVFGIISADEEVQFAVAVVVEPDRRVGIHPGGQPGLLPSHA
jgi:hypothetical protein